MYCGIDTIRSSGLHSSFRVLIQSNLDPEKNTKMDTSTNGNLPEH